MHKYLHHIKIIEYGWSWNQHKYLWSYLSFALVEFIYYVDKYLMSNTYYFLWDWYKVFYVFKPENDHWFFYSLWVLYLKLFLWQHLLSRYVLMSNTGYLLWDWYKVFFLFKPKCDNWFSFNLWFLYLKLFPLSLYFYCWNDLSMSKTTCSS